jgi:hypothetical protein
VISTLRRSLGGNCGPHRATGSARSTSNGFLTVANYLVVVVAYGLDIVVVPVLALVVPSVVLVLSVVEVVLTGEEGSGGKNIVALELPVGVKLDVVVVVVRRTAEADVVCNDVVNDVSGGAVDWREVCRTANTIRSTARRPATPAATMTPGRSCH